MITTMIITPTLSLPGWGVVGSNLDSDLGEVFMGGGVEYKTGGGGVTLGSSGGVEYCPLDVKSV